ncbi:cytochrome P450 52A12 [Drechmeria coniospora]|uniref:Cytochrome P450 52A12 n=1 Tax=Drechmeria coniospora TaxID=98403 RepID=A0A151GH75_DRECN|nr:cytochrome P450 52A12 [Drechmeria coniospora]KYK56434.1 cytochrome P450 52A12 [Drechmeria coniospora]
MHLTALSAIVAAVAVVGLVIRKVQERLRHAAKAKALGCEPAIWAPMMEPSGVWSTILGAVAAREKRLPVWIAEQFDAMSEAAGRPVGTMMMRTPFFRDTVFTLDPQNIQAMLALKFKDFGLGPNRTENFKPLLGNGIFAANGKQWEHSRALLRPQFVRSQVSDLDLEEDHVRAMMTVLERHLAADRWTDTVDLSALFFRLTLDSATEFLFGESVNSQLGELSAAAADGSSGPGGFAEAFDRSQSILAQGARLGNSYWLVHTPELHRMVKRVHDFVDYFVRVAMSRPRDKGASAADDKGAKREKYVFLHALAEDTRDPTELRSQLLNILLAGRDTTASTLGWFFYTLATPEHAPVYHRLRQLILDEFGTYDDPRDITFERMKGCQYLQWCISEILRLYPIVSVNVRTAQVDTALPVGGGRDGQSPVYIKKGHDVAYSVHNMQRRKDLWGPDADLFRPERWESRRPGWDYLPFNGGPRICIGQQFALTEIAYVVIRLMQRVDAIDPSNMGPVKHGLTLTNCPGDGVKVRLHFAS